MAADVLSDSVDPSVPRGSMTGGERGAAVRPPSITEALARRLRVPHGVVVLLIACVLGLPVVPYLFPGRAPDLFTSVYLPHLGLVRDPVDVIYQGLVFALVLFSPLATSFMLDRVWSTPRDAPWLRAAIEPEVRATVADARRPLPPLVLGTLTMVPMLVQYLASGYVASIPDGLVGGLEVAIVEARFAVIFMFVWCYLRAIIGLARMAAAPLDLLPSHVDLWLGTRALGSLALSLAIVYSVGLALGMSIVISGPAGALMIPVVLLLSALGVALFFLPLRSVHRQMAAEKAREQAWLHERLASTVTVSRHQSVLVHQDQATALVEAVSVHIAEGHIRAIRPWPIDTSIAVRLASTFVLPLLLTLVGRQIVLVVLGV